MSMHIWVFSYNRGLFLQNCIESIERCAPMCPVTVFDDNSTDPETQSVLESIAKKHRVMKPEAGVSESKHGGLYANMQSAYENMSEGELMCFMQDDTQLVRPVASDDLLSLKAYFLTHSRAGFVQPAFLRGCNAKQDRQLTRFDPEANVYFVDRYERSAGAFYSDIVIADVGRLRESSWHFAAREAQNERQARKKFGQMGYLRDPFVAWLPNVPAFRGKKETWALRKAQKLSSSGFYPIAILDDEEVAKLRSRNVTDIPYAEHFLQTSTGSVKQPWIYYPMQNRGWLKKVNALELWVDRALSSAKRR